MNAIAKAGGGLTVAEFLRWSRTAPGRWQLFDGEPRAMAPPSTLHGYLQATLCFLIGVHLRDSRLPFKVFVNPGVIPAAMSAQNMRVPDLAVAAAHVVTFEAALSDPLIAVEILSPSNSADTWANVWAYTTIPSVREIVVLKTDVIGAEWLRRAPDAAWPDRPTLLTEGALTLASIGFSVDLADIYAGTSLAGLPAG